MYTGVYAFIGGVIVIGVGLGFWLQVKLDATHQGIRFPSALTAEA